MELMTELRAALAAAEADDDVRVVVLAGSRTVFSVGYDLTHCFAYSDSVTDLPMLDAVGHPTAVNPDRALRRAASSRGWPVVSFSRPVSIRSDGAPCPFY